MIRKLFPIIITTYYLASNAFGKDTLSLKRHRLSIGGSYWSGISRDHLGNGLIYDISKKYTTITNYSIFRYSVTGLYKFSFSKRFAIASELTVMRLPNVKNYRVGLGLDYKIVRHLNIGLSVTNYKYLTSGLSVIIDNEHYEFKQVEKSWLISMDLSYFFPIERSGITVQSSFPIIANEGEFKLVRVNPNEGIVGYGGYPGLQFLRVVYLSVLIKLL